MTAPHPHLARQLALLCCYLLGLLEYLHLVMESMQDLIGPIAHLVRCATSRQRRTECRREAIAYVSSNREQMGRWADVGMPKALSPSVTSLACSFLAVDRKDRNASASCF